MNCLDCAALDQSHTPAVATCGQCGGAACLEHLWVTHRAGRPAGMAGAAQGPTRELRCGFCASGRRGQHHADERGVLAVRPCGDHRCLCGTGSIPA